MRTLILIFSILVLSGCAHYQIQKAQLSTTAICNNNAAMPELAPIRDQVPSDALKATIGQLADMRRPTAAQKLVIEHIEEYSEPCHTATMNYFNTYAPAAAPIYVQLSQNVKLLWARLLVGKINFGQFNSERAKISAAALSEAQGAESARLAQRQQLYVQQQQLNINQQRYLNSLRQSVTPKTINCHGYGNSVSCSSL